MKERTSSRQIGYRTGSRIMKGVNQWQILSNGLAHLPWLWSCAQLCCVPLLYGRSSTNCEAGFTGVQEYIANHADHLKDAYVIFISDGNINTDETPRAFDANWKTWTRFGALAVAQETFGGALNYGENLPAAFTTVFGDRFNGATNEEILTRALTDGEVTEEEFIAFAEQVWKDVYAYSGLTSGAEYLVSDAERAFVKYDKENGTYIQDLFYYTTYKSAYVTYGDRWSRTPAAANALAAMDQLEAMYVVDYDSYTSWMDTGITSDKSTFVQSNGIVGLCDALQGTLNELSKTPFNDVVITDYMSKWVNLDAATQKIVNNSTGETIWSAADGWLISENRPTAQEVPVIVEKIDPADYEAGGSDVIGNTSGDIYKLTWYVKDSAMLRSDTYSLKYEVTADTEKNGFRYNTEYPANGNTELHYTDETGEDKVETIIVPNVDTVKEVPDDIYINFKSGEASNISFMLIDEATGTVEFLYKIDIENETSFKIPTEEGKISAVFVKQSTSGMFWFSEEVEEELINAAINCLVTNNPSYKGHNAIAFGEGAHELEFKKNKFATYVFGNGEVVLPEEDQQIDEPAVETTEPTVESTSPTVEETVPEEPAAELNVTVKGAEVASWIAEGDVTAVYIAASGKVPAVIWTSEEVDAETMAAFIEALDAEEDATVLVGYGAHEIQYQHNKNKVKTVTYTFEIAE